MGYIGKPDSASHRAGHIMDMTCSSDHIVQVTFIQASGITPLGQLVRKTDRIGGGRFAPWWTPQCTQARRLHLQSVNGSENEFRTPETRAFLSLVRKAKKDYWQEVIDRVKDGSDLYKVIGWQKVGPLRFQPGGR